MSWQVEFHRDAKKAERKLPEVVRVAVAVLIDDLELNGPMRYNWKNFGKLRGKEGHYHCHVKKGHPTYVACWKAIDKKIQIIEVYYVGTHEKADY